MLMENKTMFVKGRPFTSLNRPCFSEQLLTSVIELPYSLMANYFPKLSEKYKDQFSLLAGRILMEAFVSF